MISFLTLCYCGIIWLIFFKLELLPWNRKSQITVGAIGVTAILLLVFSMNLYQPYSQDVRVYRNVVQVVPRVTGRVVEVAVKPNTLVQRGDVLFRIDPEPLQYEVDRLTADLTLKRIIFDDAKALAGARVAAEVQRDRAQAEHDKTQALLAQAQLNLREATVYASVDGLVTHLALAPGQIATVMASLPVMTVVETDSIHIIATLAQSALRFVEVGDAVEIALDRLPGRILEGRVEALIGATGQGRPSDRTPLDHPRNPENAIILRKVVTPCPQVANGSQLEPPQRR